MPIIPDNDPNEAYDVIPMPIEPHGPTDGWWTVTCNGIPVHHFAAERCPAQQLPFSSAAAACRFH